MGDPDVSLMRRLGRLALALLAAIGLLVVVVTATPLTAWYGRLLAGPWNDPAGDILIVLGGSSVEDIIGASTYWRSLYALRAWRRDGFREVVVCGARSGPPMRDFLAFQGVPLEAIRVERRSTSTRENALYTRELLGDAPGRKVLLTSDYHMFRAHRVFRKAGLEVLPRPLPDAIKRSSGWRGRWAVFVEEVEETGKILYYAARGWM
jgi:uncharacterized SAM-binding protein YcdF (DUF218 family)